MSSALSARRAGVLLHPTSLPGPGSHGTLGVDARRFVDWLAAGGFSVWQTLPLGPVDAYGSPYCLRSAYAGDPRLIDRAALAELDALPHGLDVTLGRAALYEAFEAAATPRQRAAFASYLRRERHWLRAYATFELCAGDCGGQPWWLWPAPYRQRHRPALRRLRRARRTEWRALLFEQYLFDLEWSALKRYANGHGVLLFGDLPFYVDRNSVEVWAEPELFELDSAGNPRAVAGVPPDYFNADGQLWGNPLYDWDAMESAGFRWWIDRLKAQLARFDLVRIDHFRALESYWEVPAGAATAREGQWRHGRGAALLAAVRAELGALPLVAEDLGIITDAVRELRDRFELPGMVVLQFAFDGSEGNPHLPRHHRQQAVVYTGTHDNDTTVGWYAGLDDRGRALVARLLGAPNAPAVPELLIEAAYGSRAILAVVPMQDLLAQGSASRMNTPGTVHGNWQWRFVWEQVPSPLAAECRERAVRHERLAGTSER